MKQEMKNITSTEIAETNNIVIGKKDQERFLYLPFNKKDKYFNNGDKYKQFIKCIERMVRSSKEYSYYVYRLKHEIGLNFCTLFPNITDDDATIEMHHGPIFTLFDIVEIVLMWAFKHKQPTNSSNIADLVLEDHKDDIILVTMLCKAAHIAVHKNEQKQQKDPSFFLTGKGSYGNFSAFVDKYIDSMQINHINKIRAFNDQYEAFMKEGKIQEPSVFKAKISDWMKLYEKGFKNDN